MNSITGLQFNNRGAWVVIVLANGGSCVLTIETVVAFHLKMGSKITSKQLNLYIGDSMRRLAYQLVINWLLRSPRTYAEAKNYLKRKKEKIIAKHQLHRMPIVDLNWGDLINQTVLKLRQNRYLNDKEFAKSWIAQQMRLKPTGASRMRLELQRKGVSRSIIEATFHELGILKKETINASIHDLIEKLWRKIRFRQLSRTQAKLLLASRLQSRGFFWKETQKFIDDFLSSQYNEPTKRNFRI